jgi:hypothetical protein
MNKQMDKRLNPYYEEIDNLSRFRNKVDAHTVYKSDLDLFSEQYEELISQANMITSVSDRLQKKLDGAILQIKEQNEEIQEKNFNLENTVDKLSKARVGRQASATMLFFALLLFIVEQTFLQSIVDEYVGQFIAGKYVFMGSLFVLCMLFFLVKYLEGSLETYYLNKEKKKILKQESASSILKVIFHNLKFKFGSISRKSQKVSIIR